MDNPGRPRSPVGQPAKVPNMSLESALDQERREVMNLLEGRSNRSASPSLGKDRNTSPVPAVRSMLDVSSAPVPGPGPIAGVDGLADVASPRSPQTVRSMLDLSTPSSPPLHRPHHGVTSPATSQPTSPEQPRIPSAATTQASQGLAKGDDGPKRVAQAGKKSRGSLSPSAKVIATSGELGSSPGFAREKDAGSHSSTAGVGGSSTSPSSRLHRPPSPGGNMLSPTSFNLTPAPGQIVTDSGKMINMDRAYRKLTDAAISKSGGSFSTVASTDSSNRDRLDSGESEGGIRLQKDKSIGGDGEEAVIESSEEDEDDDEELSTDEELWKSETSRGRRRRKKGSGTSEADSEQSGGGSETMIGMGKAAGPRKVKSLLAAAEEERMVVSSKHSSEPSISVTGPGGEKLAPKKSGVHPHTSFDQSVSGITSANTSDADADISDIKRAQKLSINMSNLDTSVPNRVLRNILRGDFFSLQQEAAEGLRRQRMYIVATDLSEEAVYALEWTIGTILRDGDTLLAIYAIEDEASKNSDFDDSVQIGEGAKAAQDTVNTMATLTERTKQHSGLAAQSFKLATSTYLPATESTSYSGSVDSRMMSKAQLERNRAVEDISTTCVRLLRKTKLQVRVTVEVIHCRSPKHMITEAIDELEPTLVVLGSRGRSALKGVLLGSFSNYLVTKSSVPVMVARKKLKKHAKFRSTKIRLSNNLTNPKRIIEAKID